MIKMSDLYDEISNLSKLLKIPSLNNFDQIIDKSKDFETNLKAFLQFCLNERMSNSLKRRVNQSGLYPLKTIDTFEPLVDFYLNLDNKTLSTLLTCKFIDAAEDVYSCGNSGTGKTHIAKAIGYEALLKGYSVKFYKSRNLIDEMIMADQSLSLKKYLKDLHKIQLLIIDDIGSYTLDTTKTELLYELINNRSEIRSTYYTTNHKLSQWATFLGDSLITRAIVDRVVYKSHILDFSTNISFRLLRAPSNAL
jgi:DNA replication protein DnaC